MKILIIRFSSLGDIILTQPIIQELKRNFPQAQIDYLTKKAFAPLIKEFFEVDEVLFNYKSFRDLFLLKKRKYDLVIDLHNKFNSAISKIVINGKKTVTYNKKRKLRKQIVAHKTSFSINSTLDLYYSVFTKLGLKHEFSEPEIKIKQKTELLPNKNKLNVIIFPGATHNTKRIPCQKIISFINDYEHPFTNFYLMGSPDEKMITESIAKQVNKESFDLAGKFNLCELVSAMNEGDIIITNDSGPMHIASALRKAQIAFFGSTNISLGFRPLNKKAVIISAPTKCSPCTLHGLKECPLKHFDCMQKISVDTIYANYIELLAF